MSKCKCEKCNWDMRLVLIEGEKDDVETQIWKCSNLRCGYMIRKVTYKK